MNSTDILNVDELVYHHLELAVNKGFADEFWSQRRSSPVAALVDSQLTRIVRRHDRPVSQSSMDPAFSTTGKLNFSFLHSRYVCHCIKKAGKKIQFLFWNLTNKLLNNARKMNQTIR